MNSTARPRVNSTEAEQEIAHLRPFRTSGSFQGGPESQPGYYTIGHLPAGEEFKQGLADASYVVYSYSTPIGWFSGGTWYIPAVQYSATTSRHQARVRRAAAASGYPIQEPGKVQA